MDIKFSDWLLEQLNERGWSQSELSHLTGLTRQAISYYLSGKSKQPDEFALQKIAKAFKLPPEDVYRAAGIPLSQSTETKVIRQITHLANQLPPEEQQGILEFVKLRLRLSEDRANYETRRPAKQTRSTKPG
jgi:transcriptional regulator with XRE-family HTH domain